MCLCAMFVFASFFIVAVYVLCFLTLQTLLLLLCSFIICHVGAVLQSLSLFFIFIIIFLFLKQ